MIKYLVTITLSIIGYILSHMSLSVSFSWWIGSEDWEEFTVFYLSPIYFIVLGFWIFKQKGRRGKHVGVYLVTFFVPWFFLISHGIYREYHIDQMELNNPTVAIIKDKEDSVIRHLNLREVYYRYADDMVIVSFEPDSSYTEKDINLIVNWLPPSENIYSINIDDTPNSIELYTGYTYLQLKPDKEIRYCKSNYENMCDSFKVNKIK